MASKYEIFCKVIEHGSFTKVAQELNYSQSAVSQAVKGLENELSTTLVVRDKSGVVLSADGREYYPYILSIQRGERSLAAKHTEMLGLENNTIRIGSFTGVSRNILPPLMSRFKKKYPGVRFVLDQGEYTSIAQWIKNGNVDFGFVNSDAVSGLEVKVILQDNMFAVLPPDHPLAAKREVTLAELAREPFILLDEGETSVAQSAFEAQGLTPHIEYKVYDDYSILAMIEQNLGVSLIYDLVLSGIDTELAVRPCVNSPRRSIALAWNNQDTMPLAAKKFSAFVMQELAR